MSAMSAHATALSGLVLVETKPWRDERGYFVRVFCEKELQTLRPGLHFPQINLSATFRRGTLRGMHFQRPPAAEAKLIRCIRGRIFDVAIDLRAGSPSFLRWHAVELDADGQQQLFIPEGFAHGFQALSDDVQILYMHTARWQPEHEGRVRFDDPIIDIRWPLPPKWLSDSDRAAPALADDFEGLRI